MLTRATMLAAAVLMTAVLWTQASLAGEPIISAPDAQRLVEADDVILIDVRSPTEWQQTGIPAGAIAVTIHNPDGESGFVDAVLEAVGDKSQPIALICASGVRSHRAQQWLDANGFANVADVSEGMLGRGDNPGWLRRGLPTEPCTTC